MVVEFLNEKDALLQTASALLRNVSDGDMSTQRLEWVQAVKAWHDRYQEVLEENND